MQRVLTTATLVGLLVATAAAFAITERLKLVKSPIYGTVITPVFSPSCGCTKARAAISLKFRHRDRVTVSVLHGQREVVRTIVFDSLVPRGQTVFHWDGKTDLGARARDGGYQIQVHLQGQHRTILLPNRVVIDTKPPQLLDATPTRTQISPDGDGLGDVTTIQYVLDEPAHVLVYYHGRRIIRSRFTAPHGRVLWTGRIGGQALKPGVVTLTVGAVDLAGNRTPVAERARVRVEIRYIALASRRIAGVKAGRLFDIGVSTDAHKYRWRLGTRAGIGSGPVLSLRAPRVAGTYQLMVLAHGYSDTATLIVK